MADVKSELASFDLLGVDSKSVQDARDTVNQLESRIQTATQDLLKLNPTAKDYDSKMANLQSLTNAYKAQLEQAQKDLEQAVKALKLSILDDIGKYLNKDWQLLRDLDAAIIEDLLEVRDLVQSRGKATIEFDAKRSILDDWNYQLQAGKGGRDSKLPWRKDFPTPWANALREYIRRFLELGGDNGNRPGANQDVLEWIAKR